VPWLRIHATKSDFKGGILLFLPPKIAKIRPPSDREILHGEVKIMKLKKMLRSDPKSNLQV
jgi:hypothetical protein